MINPKKVKKLKRKKPNKNKRKKLTPNPSLHKNFINPKANKNHSKKAELVKNLSKRNNPNLCKI